MRWGLIGVVLATAFIGAVMLLVGLQTERLTCDARSCTDGHSTFERSELHCAHHVVENGSKNTKYGVVVLELANGERRTMHVEPAEAEAVANAIRSACDRGTPIDVELHEPRWMIVAAFVLFLASAIFAGIAAARLRLVCADSDLPLTERFYSGHALHLRAAAALRTALALEPDPDDDAALAAIPMVTTAIGQRVMLSWAGLTTGGLLGLALFGICAALLHVVSLRANIEGWVFAAGFIPGAIAGVAIVLHATRPRLPR